jgi:hypothetical protein
MRTKFFEKLFDSIFLLLFFGIAVSYFMMMTDVILTYIHR